MPEGDTVWRVARTLDRALSGTILTGCDLRVPALATVDLTGGRVNLTLSRGKHLLTRIDGPGDQHSTLHTHLKMEGSWHVYRPESRWRRPAHEARVVLRTAEWHAVGFALGVVELLDRTAEDAAVGHLGPDLLGSGWDEDEALRRLRARPDRAVGEAFLDQSALAGVGNMYKSELCFLSGVDPRTPVGRVPDLHRMVRRARALLEANKERVQQTTTGDLRRGHQTWVYRRDRQACRRCGTPVAMEMQGVEGRASYWCPTCQPLR